MRRRGQGEPFRLARWRAWAGRWAVVSAAVAGMAVLPTAQAVAQSPGHVGKPALTVRGVRMAALTPSGPHAYVTNSGTDTVSVIDTASNTVRTTVTVGNGPIGVAVTPDGTHAYVINQVTGTCR